MCRLPLVGMHLKIERQAYIQHVRVSNNSKASLLKSCFWEINHICPYLLRRQYLKIQNPERWSPLKERKRQRKKGYHFKTKRP